jgi:hypothetical protein
MVTMTFYSTSLEVSCEDISWHVVNQGNQGNRWHQFAHPDTLDTVFTESAVPSVSQGFTYERNTIFWFTNGKSRQEASCEAPSIELRFFWWVVVVSIHSATPSHRFAMHTLRNLPTQPMHLHTACSIVHLAPKPTSSFLQVNLSLTRSLIITSFAYSLPSHATHRLPSTHTMQATYRPTSTLTWSRLLETRMPRLTSHLHTHTGYHQERHTFSSAPNSVFFLEHSIPSCRGAFRFREIDTWFPHIHALEICHVYCKPYHYISYSFIPSRPRKYSKASCSHLQHRSYSTKFPSRLKRWQNRHLTDAIGIKNPGQPQVVLRGDERTPWTQPPSSERNKGKSRDISEDSSVDKMNSMYRVGNNWRNLKDISSPAVE